MGGDLNTKKSWHPKLLSNQKRVWEEEKNALAERQLVERLRKERQEERELEELQRLQEKSGGKVPVKRVDWMYNGPSSNDAVTEEREAYLLGKRRVDNLLKDDTESLKKGATVGIDAVGQPTATTARDTQKKVLEDPLLLIQKQKMEMQMKQAKAALKAKQYEEKRAKEKERERRHKHRHHHHSRRDRSRSASADYDDRERRHHRSRRGDDRDDRHRRRSRSPRRDDRAARRDSGDNYRQRSRSRSRSPYRKSHREENNYRKRSRSRSPRRRDYDDDRDSSHRRRDRSPARRSHEDHHRRPRRPSPPQTHSSTKETAAPAPGPSAAERLAAMQADASSLEDQRLERLRQLEQDVAAEEEKRRNDRGGKERFISGVRNRAADGMDLGDAIARGRQGLSREVGA